jgi:hypothetical protein
VSEPKVIYLGPACEASTGDGRTWAEDNPWPDCECGHRPVQYVLGETFDRMKAERDALQLRLNAADQQVDQAVTALNEIARVSRMGEKPFEIATLAIGEMSAMVEQPESEAVVRSERSPKDYAIEHAEFMATSADHVLAKFQDYGLALLAVDEGGDDGEGELFENIDSARGDLQESLVELRGMVYEFRKRCSRLNAKSR